MSMLSVKHISKTYPGEHYGAVNDVSFELRKQEILTITGRSGSGKSTLLQMLAGLMKPDNGMIEFHGTLLENPEEQLIAGHPKIKMVFQDYKVKAGMTVEENVKYMLLNYHDDFKKERTEELLKLTGLVDFRLKKTHELSGGQLQRLSIARALADGPELLLMDEPFSNLDPITKENIIIVLRDILKNEGISIVLVTHDTRDALMVSDRIGYMSLGNLLQIESGEDIYSMPVNLEVASFFGRVNNLYSITGKEEFIRAEKMYIEDHSDDGCQMEVVDCFNTGHGFLLMLSHKSQDQYYIYSKRRKKTGETINVCFEDKDILSFSG